MTTSLQRLLFFAFLLVSAETLFAVPFTSVELAYHSNPVAWTAGLVVLIAASVLFLRRSFLLNRMRQGLLLSERFSIGSWLRFWLVAGLALRLTWALVFRAPLASDALEYFKLAKGLVEQHSYIGAYWPPGYPLFLFPFFAILGAHVWVTTLAALLLFVISYWIGCRLAKRLSGDVAVRVVSLLLAIWPGYLTLVGVGAKECLLLALVPGAILAYVSSFDRQGSGRWSLLALAGMLLGWSTLVQPGNMLLPAAFCAIELALGRLRVQSVARVVVLVSFMVLVIAPWTWRNYREFHHVVLVTTNGGDVFYRANNPKASANYSQEGEKALPSNEFEADKQGYRMAFEWIHDHPLAFLSLSVRKQVNFLGDDSLGFYETLKRSLDIHRGYFLAKMIGNGFWLVLWCVLFWEASEFLKTREERVAFTYCATPLLYQWLIDSVFESGVRHHVPYITFMAVLLGSALAVGLVRPSVDRVPELEPAETLAARAARA